MTVPDRTTFESAYAGQAPWDIGRPQKAFIDVADQITGSVLDAGCGTGDNALAFAEGWAVESIEPTRFEVRPDLKEISFSPGGPRAWLVVVRRAG